MNAGRFKRSKGVTLIEAMIAAVILSVAVIGASGYRYYAVLDANEADEHIAAARVALLLCESWRGVKGSTTYDPTTYFGSELPITADSDFMGSLSSGSGSFTTLGAYQVTLEGINYSIVLSYADVNPSLRALNVVIGRPRRSQRVNGSAYSTSSPYDPMQTSDDPDTYKLFKLTTYTEI